MSPFLAFPCWQSTKVEWKSVTASYTFECKVNEDDVLDNVTLYLMTTTHINGYLPYGMICAILYLNLDFME